MNTSLFLSIRDEIALEGLEGITFEALWTRLTERDRFLREETGKVQFFKLPSARPPLVIFNRNEHFNEETGTLLYDHAKIPLDLYSPVKCVETKEVRGSCRDFKARQDVTEQVVKFTSFRELLQADGEEGLGEDLSAIVAVASQKLRAEAMLGTSQWHTYAEMKLETYCILEYIARKRFYGYLNSVSEGMKFEDRRVKNSFYYYRNDLFRAGLLAQFPIFFFDGGRRMVTSSFVLYLTRFKPRNVNPIDWKVLELGNSLFVERQVTTLPFEVVKDHHLALGKKSGSTTSSAPPPTTATATDDQPTEEEETTTTTRKQTYVEQKSDNRRFRDFLQRYSKVFSVKRVDQEEDQVPTTPQSGRARVFYVVEYLQPLDRRLTLDDLYAGYSEKQQQQQSANVVVKEEDDEEGRRSRRGWYPTPMEVARAKFHQLKRYFVERLYAVVERAGATGCTRVDLLRLLNVPNFLVRNSLKGLMAAEQVTAASVQRGRQKVYIYRAKRFSTSPDIIEIPISPSSSSTAQKGHLSNSLDSALASLGSSADHQRNRRRLELILEYVGAAGFADNLFNLRRHLKAVEQQQQRLAFSIDMRTVLRLLRSLLDGGVISIRCFRLSAGGGGGGGGPSSAAEITAAAVSIFAAAAAEQKEKEQKEVVVPAKKRGKSKEDDLLLLSLDCPECPATVRDPASQALYLNNLLEHLLLLNKFSLFAQHQVDLRTEITVTPFPFPEMGRPGQSSVTLAAAYALKVEEDETPSASISTHIVSLTAAERTNFVYEPSFTRAKYGGKRSKVERAFALYRYLFYLLVDEEKTKSTATEEVILSTDWRYHVPKLCRLYPDLKCTVLDALLYMPLSVFRDVYQITHVVPGLEALLADRHRQHQLLSEVEPAVRRHLLYNRRALNAIFELMDWAAAFGLLRDFAEQLQFRETVTFQLVTRLTFPRPLIEGDSTVGGGGPDSVRLCLPGGLGQLRGGRGGAPAEEEEWGGLLALDVPLQGGAEDALAVRIWAEGGEEDSASKGKKRPRREVESGEEEEEEEEEVAKSGKKPATRKRSKPNTFSASAQKQTIIKCEIEESDSVLKVKDKRGTSSAHKQSPAGPGRRLLRQYWTREEDAFLLKCRLASILLDPKTPYQTCVSRTVIAEQLHLHVASSRGGKGGVTKDGDGCARRLLKLQRVIGEEELATRLRPANRQDTEAMVAAFKVILGRILAHKFTSTEFFLERKGSGKGGTLLASFDDEEEEDGSNGSNGSEVVEAVSNARPALADLLASYDILDVASDERSLQKAAVFKSDPVTFYDVHHYVRTNLLLSTLTSIKFALDRIGPDSSSESTPTPESPLAPQPTTQLTITLKNFYLRTMSRALKHFPNLRLQETIVQLLDRDLIKRNRKTLKAQQILGAGYRISPAYFQRLTRFYRAFDRDGLKVWPTGTTSSARCSLRRTSRRTLSAFWTWSRRRRKEGEEEEEDEENSREAKKAGQKRPIEFHIEVPQTFFSLAKDELNARGSNRGRQVSRSLMLSKNLAELEEEEEEEESTSSKAKKQSDPSDWNSEMMTVNHLKVCLKRQPRSRRALSAGYAQALELLRLHSRTFEPRSAHLLQQCLDQFPWTVDEEEEEDGDDVMEISAAASVLTIEQAKAAVEAIQNVRSEGLGLKWEQLLAAVFGGQAKEVSQEVQAELKRFLAFCETRKLLFAVGIVTPTTAAAETSSTATTTTSNSGEAKQICFLPKLWKLPDGRADLETLMAAFTAILGHLSFTSPTMDRRRLLEALEWALPPVQLDELLEILLAVECIRRVPSVVGMESAQQQQQQQKKKEVTNPTTLSASFDDFFASADRDRRHLPLLSRSLSNEDDDDDVEMIDADVQKQQQKKKTTQGKQAVQQEGEGEICYEAAVDAFSRLTIFYEALREELPPTSVLTT
ncbi:General transcription factor 3C polypeptide 1 [Tyrophagus putrescentiae]|nr:General transcription factor 3C polypeptide 1 [Tyrophagus putrescentiae]